MESLTSQTPKPLNPPRTSSSIPPRPRELCRRDAIDFHPGSPWLWIGFLGERARKAIKQLSPAASPSTPGLFSSLKLHPSGFLCPPSRLTPTFFQGLHNSLLLFPKETLLGRAGLLEKLCQCPESINLI